MKPTIIVADDSLTIQKVIKITLANEELELVECLEDHKLISLCKEVSPTLVLLDFNLSETKTGYDLVKELKAIGVPKVLMLYGTFDTVDEHLLNHSRTNEHIVKPFEGSKFITLVRQLLEDASTGSEESIEVSSDLYPDEIQPESTPAAPKVEDQWVVNQPNSLSPAKEDKTDEHDMKALLSSPSTSALADSMNDWGVDIPGVIEGAASGAEIELPPVIDAEDTEHIQELVDEKVFPIDDDLEYPDVEKIKNDVANSTPKLTPMFELNEVATGKEYELNDTIGTKTDAEIHALEEMIANETTEDLWSVDEAPEPELELTKEENVEIINEVVNKTDESIEAIVDSSLSKSEILSALELKIEEIVNARVEAILEKVAWEVIPDLAENLITKEIKELANAAKES